jgi:hypothetical protein
MVEHLANLASVELKVRMHEMQEADCRNEDEKIRVVSSTLRVERIVT